VRNFILVTAALAAIASAPAWAEDIACPTKADAALAATLGEPVAWLGADRTVHAPAGLTMIGQPVAYVIAVHAGDQAGAPVSELDYRLQGINRPFGQRFSSDLRKAFDTGFTGSDCAGGKTSCVLTYKTTTDGSLSGAELSEGNLSMPKEAHGDGLGPVKADYNLDSADPVFLVCHYQVPN